MRTLTSLAIAFAIWPGLVQQNASSQSTAKPIKKPGVFSRARFETKYDKFKDKTTVQFKRLPLTGTGRRVWSGETLYLVGAFDFAGPVLTAPVEVAYLGFISKSKDWIYLRDQHLIGYCQVN